MNARGRASEGELVGSLYDAALGRVPWAEVVKGMTEVLEGATATLFLHDPIADVPEILGMHNNSPHYIEAYASTFVRHDLWANEAMRRRHHDRATLGQELVSEDTFRRSLIYNEFLRSGTDAFYLLGALQRLHGGGSLVIGCHRPSSVDSFSQSHKETLGRLLPHFQRAAELRQHLRAAQAGLDELRQSIDDIGIGLIHLDSQRRLVYANAEATRILEAHDGLNPTRHGVQASHKDEDSRLQALLTRAISTTAGNAKGDAGGYLRVSRPSGKVPYGLLVSPLGRTRPVLMASSAAVALFVTDADGISIEPAALSELYSLSPAEARVVAAIAMGHKVRDIAERLDITFNTARTLVARAMAKTETGSQLELMKLVLTGPSGLRYRKIVRPGQ